MGVDTKAIIRKDVSLKELIGVLSKKYGKVEVHTTHSDDFYQLIFKDGEDRRQMAVFFDAAERTYKIDGVLLSLGHWGNSIEIMKYLLDLFGGYLDENDCDDEDFYPINIEGFEEAKTLSDLDKFKNKIVAEYGYENLQKTINLFNEYRAIQN